MTDKGALSPAWSMSLYWHKYSCSFLSCQTQPKLHLNNFEYFSHPMFVFTKQTPRAFQKVVLSYTWVWQASSEELVFTVFVYIGAWLDSCKTASLNSYWTPSTEQANSCGPSGPASQITNYNTVQQAEREKKKKINLEFQKPEMTPTHLSSSLFMRVWTQTHYLVTRWQ